MLWNYGITGIIVSPLMFIWLLVSSVYKMQNENYNKQRVIFISQETMFENSFSNILKMLSQNCHHMHIKQLHKDIILFCIQSCILKLPITIVSCFIGFFLIYNISVFRALYKTKVLLNYKMSTLCIFQEAKLSEAISASNAWKSHYEKIVIEKTELEVQIETMKK